MSRPRVSLAPLKALSLEHDGLNTKALTEEYEQTEHSITLALQEIDRNFTQANRIIAERVRPALDRYLEESRKIWAGGEFWKQFMETSAEVSLTVYEEDTLRDNNDHLDQEALEEELKHTEQALDDLVVDDDAPVESTPRRPVGSPTRSPSRIPILVDPTRLTPMTKLRYPGENPHTPRGIQASPVPSSSIRHQVLDKSWIIQATPKPRYKQTKKTTVQTASQKHPFLEDSPEEPEIPKFESGITFGPSSLSKHNEGTPVKPSAGTEYTTPKRQTTSFYDLDSDSDPMERMSPPVTVQFGLSKNKLMRTPARQVARSVVSDILRQVGGAEDSSTLSQESYLNDRNFGSP